MQKLCLLQFSEFTRVFFSKVKVLCNRGLVNLSLLDVNMRGEYTYLHKRLMNGLVV